MSSAAFEAADLARLYSLLTESAALSRVDLVCERRGAREGEEGESAS